MAGFTDISCINMGSRFAARLHTIMATDAIADNVLARMIKLGRQKRHGSMANIAFTACRDMVKPFARCGLPIVTRCAHPDDLVMVYLRGRYECCGIMALLTFITGCNMSDRFSDKCSDMSPW